MSHDGEARQTISHFSTEVYNKHTFTVIQDSFRRSDIFYFTYSLWVTVKLEPIPADLGHMVKYTLDRAPAHCRAGIYTYNNLE